VEQHDPNDAGSNMCRAVLRQVVDAVNSALLSLGVAAERLSDPNVPILRLLHDDDVTFDFIPEVQRALGVEVPPEAWEHVQTIQDVVDLLYRYTPRPS
jgi:hypothetical protein